MNSLLIMDDLSGFAPKAALIGEGQPADLVWSREQFVLLCNVMRNDNPANEFLHAYCDSNGVPRFVKAKSANVEKRVTWSWDTITGRAKAKVGIGFYPWNSRGETRWAAIDFDAHDGEAVRAKTLALAAFEILYRYSQFYLILTTSGSDGWHLFVFSVDFHPVEDWVRLLKRVVDQIGANIKSGICEIFPNETRNGSRPYAIRAPGTWNPKTNQLGAIFFTSVALLVEKKEKREVSPFLYPSTQGVNDGHLNDSGLPSFYCGGKEDWLKQFAITQAGSRHSQLKELVSCIFRQVSCRGARVVAAAQYRGARVQPKATLAEHLEEFEEFWSWMTNQWRGKLSDLEQKSFLDLATEIERELFRILKNFARYAAQKNEVDFAFSIQNVADRLGVSFQYISKLRQRFVDACIIEQTAAAVTNRSAARFRWRLPTDHGLETADTACPHGQ